MRFSRRYRGIVVVLAALAVLGVVFRRPILLAGAAVVGGWLLARQYAFAFHLGTTIGRLDVEQSVSPAAVRTDDDTTVSLGASLPDASRLDVRVESSPPVPATGVTRSERSVRLRPGDRTVDAEFDVSWPVAGEYRFDPPTLELRDPGGLFGETAPSGPTAEVVVEPRTPQPIHVGASRTLSVAAGDDSLQRVESGISPAEVREYVPGDSIRRIDWKTTSRFGRLHIREFESDSDHDAVLFVDVRPSMRTGPPGETKLDYARQTALSLVRDLSTRRLPLGCYVVGQHELRSHDPAADDEQYERVRRTLFDLSGDESTPDRPANGPRAREPAIARRTATRLRLDRSAFGETLRPYFAASGAYVDRVQDEPLYTAIRRYQRSSRGRTGVVVLTDDTDWGQLREIVRLVSDGNVHVTLFVAPSVLFEPPDRRDTGDAVDRYRTFRARCRALGAAPHVSAVEMAPTHRRNALVDALDALDANDADPTNGRADADAEVVET